MKNHRIFIEVAFEVNSENMDTANDYAYAIKEKIVDVFRFENSKVVGSSIEQIEECE